MSTAQPTPHAEVNAVLAVLQPGVREILGEHFVGLYLHGSLANGDFDRHSDVDFVVVTQEEIDTDECAALDGLHQRIASLDSWCATQLEGTYIAKDALRRFDPAHSIHANIDRGRGQRLKLAQYDESWIVQCHVLREHGITLAGPPAASLIDPVTPDDLRQAMVAVLRRWSSWVLEDPAKIRTRGYQSYTVLTICRILYTLQHGAVASKREASRWAQQAFLSRFARLIAETWEGRSHPDQVARPEDVEETLELVRSVAVSESQRRPET